MRLTFLRGIALGATIGAVTAAATVAFASTLPFTLGATNRVDASSAVTNANADGSQNTVAKPLLSLNNTTADPAASALALKVASGHAPFTTNSAQKVTNLNADLLDGLDSASLQRRVTGTCAAGSAMSAIASNGTVTCQDAGNTGNADTLDGIDSTGFIQGQGRIATIDTSVPFNGADTVLNLPGFVRIDAFCNTDGTGQYAFGVGPAQVRLVFDNGGSNPTVHTLDANTSTGSSFWQITRAGDAVTMSLEGGGDVATVFLFNYEFTSTFLHQSFCAFQGHAIIHGA